MQTILLGLCVFVSAFGAWPPEWEIVRIPSTVVMTVAFFSILSYLTSFIPVARQTLAITDRYFRAADQALIPYWPGRVFAMKEKTLAAVFIMFIILLNQLQVWFSVLLTFAGADMSNAMQSYDAKAFWYALLVTIPLALAPFLIALALEFLAANALAIRWRRWLTDDYTRRWLNHHNHYGMMLAGVGTDNPDQRIQEDIPRFIDGGQFGGLGIYGFSIQLIVTLSSLVSYAIILWSLSDKLAFPGTEFKIPGFLFWCALVYACLGTGLAGIIGRPLARLAFARQHYEANFRFGLARLREYCEQIALLFGEPTESKILKERFVSIVRNFYSILVVKTYLTTFQRFFNNISEFIPYIIMGSFYFARVITLGDLSKASAAFGVVNTSLTFFVTYYSSLADFKSVLDRLTTFDTSLDAVPPPPAISPVSAAQGRAFIFSNVLIKLPNGHSLSAPLNLRLAANENVLVTGPSGAGKSTFFRAMSGVWPYVEGMIEAPAGMPVMVLPQKPYLPIGTLYAAICYPELHGTYDMGKVKSVLADVGLGHIVHDLDMDDNWSQRLSGGEQQRLAIARALLARPSWLLLDEATSAMDVKLERNIYELIARELPETTVISIAHRPSLADHHARHLTMLRAPDGVFSLEDIKIAAE